VLRLVGIDGQTGQTRAIIHETSETFIDYSGKFFLEELKTTGELILDVPARRLEPPLT